MVFDQLFINKLKNAKGQKKRFLILYPYLKKYMLPILKNIKFKAVNGFDWDDLVSDFYYNMYLLCFSVKWLNGYAPAQIKKFLFLIASNEMMKILKKKKIERQVLNIDEYADKLFFQDCEVSILDQIDEEAKGIEFNLNNYYMFFFKKKGALNECKKFIKRQSRIISEKIIIGTEYH